MDDIVVGSIAIPGVVAALVAAAWGLLSQRGLKQLEARLARQGEAFRLAQSPRVEAALALWAAAAEFERAVRDLVTPYYATHLPEEAGREERRLAFAEHEERARRAVRAAQRRWVAARARGECLLGPATFEAVVAFRDRAAEAGDLYWISRGAKDDGDGPEARAAAVAALEEAARLRPAAVAALRAVIDAP
jgi:hypothetical protein